MQDRCFLSHQINYLFQLDVCFTRCSAGSSTQVEMDSCVSYLHFPVGHSMAPLSHLLVYYVRENGEGVTDSVQIPVQADFENQVCGSFQIYRVSPRCSTEQQIKVQSLTSQDVHQWSESFKKKSAEIDSVCGEQRWANFWSHGAF